MLPTNYYTKTIINSFLSGLIIIPILLCISKDVNIKLGNIILFLLVADAMHYWLHRCIHRTPFLREHLHSTHHDTGDLLPLDIFYSDHKEHVISNVTISLLPYLFIPLNVAEFIITCIISLIHVIYIHSESTHTFVLPLFISSDFHKKHHHIGGGNYSMYFSIWDDYMNTKIHTRLKKHKIKKV